MLALIGAPATPANIRFLDAWQKGEGGTATNNPLNTTKRGYAGETDYNSVGVKNYPTPSIGAIATAQTLQNGYYPHIVAALRSGNPASVDSAQMQSLVKELKTWGTTNFANSIQVKGGLATGVDPGDFPGGQTAADVAGGVKNATVAIGEFLGKLSDTNNLLRAGQVVGGALLVGIGLYLLANQVGLAPSPGKVPGVIKGGADPVESAFSQGEEQGLQSAARRAGRQSGRAAYQAPSQNRGGPRNDGIPF